ncbi:outer membrane protein assembly factor BamB [Aidingimonas halophila]|uniref:Outer membrane protein assembly factor BamB n=1 Tax=Aidingimonas halophila TaxID=574349 RepID=A0A1H2ZPB5_9GAMM|nr:outer membrane protein assembly factor BamB [Aidingimonas halophila]GHC16322.1 outer membrane protein assembly factor BamB [Aidingimonas halophila]SDX18559.1 Beta-barrel assembly machine subunit BamB [Aidingimonas halophila]
MKPTFLIIATALTLLAGCASNSQPDTPPKELIDFDASVSLDSSWSLSIGDGLGRARYPITPARDGGTLFAASADGQLVAIDADDGEQRWTRDLDTGISSGLSAIAGQLYVGTQDGDVLALDQEDGDEVWSSRVSSEVLAAPQPNSNLVIVQSADGNITALDRRNGSEAWVFDSSEPALTLRGTATPQVIDQVSFVGLSDGRLATLDNRNGETLWDMRIATPQGRSEVERLVDVDAQPLLTQDGRLYVTSYNGRLVALEATSGETLWEREQSSYLTPLLVGDTLITVDEDSHITALDALSGRVLWQSEQLEGRRLTAPAQANGYVVVGDFDGYLHLLDVDNGELAGRTRVNGSGISQRPLTDGTRIHALANDGRLETFELQD